jgi:hypothetical protein
MTEVMQVARPGLGLGLTTPSSRQDVISALLNDYGNSFGRDDESSSQYSPVPALKELPPPPPSSDEKPLPAQPLMMRFQLRGRFLFYSSLHGLVTISKLRQCHELDDAIMILSGTQQPSLHE